MPLYRTDSKATPGKGKRPMAALALICFCAVFLPAGCGGKERLVNPDPWRIERAALKRYGEPVLWGVRENARVLGAVEERLREKGGAVVKLDPDYRTAITEAAFISEVELMLKGRAVTVEPTLMPFTVLIEPADRQ